MVQNSFFLCNNFDHIIRGAYEFKPLVLNFCHYTFDSLHGSTHGYSDNPFFRGFHPQFSSQKVVFLFLLFTCTMVYMILLTERAGRVGYQLVDRGAQGHWVLGVGDSDFVLWSSEPLLSVFVCNTEQN